MLHFFLDTSGKDGDPVRVAAGYLAKDKEWVAFEREWRRALSDARVEQFHATDLYARRGEFDGWDVKREAKFARRFAAIAAKRAGTGFAVGVEPKAFRRVLGPVLKGGLGLPHRRMTPLMVCTVALLAEVADRPNPYPSGSIAAFLEAEEGGGEVIEYFNLLRRRRVPWAQAYSSVCTAGKTLLPLQAADLLAHESWRRLKEMLKPTGREVRRPMARLMRDRDVTTRVLTESNMLSLVPVIQEYVSSGKEC